MRKILTFLFAALMSVGMYATPVTWNSDDITGSWGSSFTKDGVTITVGNFIDFDDKNFTGGGTFTTTLGNFTKIEVSCDDCGASGTGWTGNNTKKTWEGTASSSVSFSGDLMDNGMGTIQFVFTIEVSTAPLANGYYLVGSEKGWTVGDLDATKLFAETSTSGEYTLATTLAENEELKVVKVENSTITTWYPAEGPNYTVDASHAGEKTIYFRPAGKTAWAAYGGHIYIDPFVAPTIKLHGNFSGSWDDTEVFTDNGDGTASFTYSTLAAGSYQFGVKINDTWTANGAAFTRANNSAEVVAGSSNLTLTADIVGDYTFTWNYDANTLTVTYPIPTIKLHGNFSGSWGDTEVFTDNGDGTASLTYSALAAGSYEFGVKINDTWTANGVAFTRANNSAEVVAGSDNLTLAADIKGNYTFVWNYTAHTLTITFPTLADGYYLVGSVKGWTVGDLDATKLFAETSTSGEYTLATTLVEDEQLKVVKVENYAITTWYPDGEGNHYTVDAAHAGEKTIYFRPVYNSDWAAYGGHIFIDPYVYPTTTIRSGLTVGNYYTLCYNKAMTNMAGATFYSIGGKDATSIYLVEETATEIEKGKPYIIQATATELTAVVGDVTETAGTNGAIHGTFANMDQAALDAASTSDVYLLHNNQICKASGQTGNSLPANRAYIVLAEVNGGAPLNVPANRVRRLPLQENTATGVDQIINDQSQMTNKVLRNGQLFIIKNGVEYNAQGMLVK